MRLTILVRNTFESIAKLLQCYYFEKLKVIDNLEKTYILSLAVFGGTQADTLPLDHRSLSEYTFF